MIAMVRTMKDGAFITIKTQTRGTPKVFPVPVIDQSIMKMF